MTSVLVETSGIEVNSTDFRLQVSGPQTENARLPICALVRRMTAAFGEEHLKPLDGVYRR